MLKNQCVMLPTRKEQAGQKLGGDSDLPFLCHTDTYRQVCSVLHPPVTTAALLHWDAEHLGEQSSAEASAGCAILRQLSAVCGNGNQSRKLSEGWVG